MAYPDSVDSTDRVTIAHNRQRQATVAQDQIGTLHALGYDFLGRPVSDSANMLGTNVDGAVRRIETAYEVRGMVSIFNYPQPGVTMALNDGTGGYPGLDIFGRVVDLPWSKTTTGDLAQLEYGYDLASNRTYRADVKAESYSQPLDEKYSYDGLDRLTKLIRGTLSGGVITSPSLKQSWGLDATGNWQTFDQVDTGFSDGTFDQARTSNTVNEITAIGGDLGTPWLAPSYDRAGNMTIIPEPNALTSGYVAVFDAWKRLRKLIDEHGEVVQENQYDGRNYRVVRTTAEETRDVYYSRSWQVLEEVAVAIASSSASSASPASSSSSSISGRYTHLQNVWGVRYIDDLVLRDRSVSGLLDERRYGMQDANWNMVAICDVSGAVKQRYNYTAYGVPTLLNPDFTAYSGATNYEWTMLYTGRELDIATGLYCYRARFYHAALGVFIGRDPIGYDSGDINLYQYCGDNPLGYIDPFGNASGGYYYCADLAHQLIEYQVAISNAVSFPRWYPNRWLSTIVALEKGNLIVLRAAGAERLRPDLVLMGGLPGVMGTGVVYEIKPISYSSGGEAGVGGFRYITAIAQLARYVRELRAACVNVRPGACSELGTTRVIPLRAPPCGQLIWHCLRGIIFYTWLPIPPDPAPVPVPAPVLVPAPGAAPLVDPQKHEEDRSLIFRHRELLPGGRYPLSPGLTPGVSPFLNPLLNPALR